MSEKKSTPAIRFAGFTDAWEQRKLGELCTEFKSGDFIRAEEIEFSGPYPVYGGNGLRGYTDRYNHDGEYALIGRQGALCGNMNFSFGKAYFTEHAVAVKADKFNDTRFLFYCFGNMNLGQYSGQSAQPGLAVGNLVELKTLVPSKPEQEKISATLTHLDALITLHQRKYDKLVKVKKAMLEKMFPKGDAKVPEIRFAGFTDAWEQRKLDEFVSFFSGLTYSPADIRQKGTLVLRSSNVKDGEVIDADNVYVDPAVVNSENVQDGDIIVVVRNGSRALIGKHAEIKGFKPNTVIGAFMTGIRSEHPSFLNALLNTPRFDKEVEMNMGATINQITGYMFSKMEFMVPAPDEQDAIGDYFKRLDDLITLHQRKLEKLKTIKKSMLESMFV